MPFKKFEIQDGNEIRGFKIRLYPSIETEEKLKVLEGDLRHAWNWLVSQTENVLRVRTTYAIKNNLVPARPVKPDYNGMTSEQAKEAKKTHLKACFDWSGKVHKATEKLAGLEYRKFKDQLDHFGYKHDYQLLGRVVSWWYQDRDIALDERLVVPNAYMFQALMKNYMSKGSNQRRKKFRKKFESMPLQVRSGKCFETGEFGYRRKSIGGGDAETHGVQSDTCNGDD